MLFATVSRGKNRGTRLLPHRFKDDRYHVQLGKKGPYIPLNDHRDIPSYLASGFGDFPETRHPAARFAAARCSGARTDARNAGKCAGDTILEY